MIWLIKKISLSVSDKIALKTIGQNIRKRCLKCFMNGLLNSNRKNS